MPNAVVYLRQSRDTEGTGLAVERQRIDCEALCAARGWTVAKVITENDTSASKGDRVGWSEVLRMVAAREVDVIVGWHVDRLTRKLTELEHLITLAERTGVRVATVSGDIDLGTDAGRLVGRILASVARGEVERKGARQRRAGEQAAIRGDFPGAKIMFGYTRQGQIIEQEAATVREVFARFNAGASVRSIARWANTVSRNTDGQEWNPWTIRNMLKRSTYAGIRTYRKEEIGPGNWTPLVDEAVWRAAAAKVSDPSRATYSGSKARKHLGSLRFQCGKCGRSPMQVNYQSKYGYRVYRCIECYHARRAEPIDSFVDRMITARLRRVDLAKLLARDAPDVEPLKARAAALRAKLDVLADDYADGRLNGRQVQRASSKIEGELKIVERKLADAGQSSALASLATAPDAGAAWLAADLGVRGAVLDALATVTILPVRPGPREFEPESIRIDWTEAEGAPM